MWPSNKPGSDYFLHGCLITVPSLDVKSSSVILSPGSYYQKHVQYCWYYPEKNSASHIVVDGRIIHVVKQMNGFLPDVLGTVCECLPCHWAVGVCFSFLSRCFPVDHGSSLPARRSGGQEPKKRAQKNKATGQLVSFLGILPVCSYPVHLRFMGRYEIC